MWSKKPMAVHLCLNFYMNDSSSLDPRTEYRIRPIKTLRRVSNRSNREISHPPESSLLSPDTGPVLL